MANKDKTAIRLKNLNDLFELVENNPLEKQQEKPIPNISISSSKVIEIKNLVPFADHLFHLYNGERLEDMVVSIRSNGVLVPIIVRRKDTCYEILSGHNRVNASQIAGLTVIPAVVHEKLSDEEAWIYVIETNLMQRSFSDMAHSEKAAVIAMQHSKMFSQGKRNDILKELKTLENSYEHKEKGTSPQIEQKLDSRELIAKEYGLNRNTIARYLRINKLIQPLKTALDNDIIAFIPAVEVSFLSEDEQIILAECFEEGYRVNIKKSTVLREYSFTKKLDKKKMVDILLGVLGQRKPPNRTPVVKVSKSAYSRYFQPNQSAKEVQAIVEKALEEYFNK